MTIDKGDTQVSIRVVAASTGKNPRQANGLGRLLGGALATPARCADGEGSGAPSGRLLTLLALVAAAVALLLTPAFASAALPEHKVLETFGSANEPTFTKPVGLAVDQSTGDLLVLDNAAGTLSRWNPDGTPAVFSSLASNVIPGLTIASASESQVAIDNSGGATDGNIYVTKSSGAIIMFSKTGAALGELKESSEGAFGEICGVAVGPEGAVYVGEYGEGAGGEIHKFAPSGSVPAKADNTKNFHLNELCAVAAGAGPSTGSVFANRIFGGPALKLDAETGAEEYPLTSGAATITTDPSSGHVYALRGTELLEFDASGPSLQEVSKTVLPHFAEGVAVNGKTGDVYVSYGEGVEKIDVFSPLESALTVTKTGTGGGTVECEIEGGGLKACPVSVRNGKKVKVVATPDGSSEPAVVTGTGSATACAGSPCEFEITEESSVSAQFKLKPGAPSVTSVSPAQGPVAGNTKVLITGVNLEEASKVEFGSTEATIEAKTATTIEVKSPSHAAGIVDVTVTAPGGTSATGAGDKFTYLAVPAVTGVNPAKGPTAGGNTVEITGTGLGEASKVEFGSTVVNAPFTEDTATKIKVIAPPCSAGTLDIKVTTAGGTSTILAADQYTCVAPPAVTAVTPAKGPTVGGNTVEITGTDLGEASKVEFGSTVVNAPFTEDTATKIKVTAPACSAGTLDIKVIAVGGTSSVVAADQYTCVNAPTITAVNPAKGPLTAGNPVTVTGTNLQEASFDFAANPATEVVVNPAGTSATMKAPACIAPGIIDVTAITPGGTSATGVSDKYTCLAAPTVTAVTPAKGPVAGATEVTITGTNMTAASKVEFGGTVVSSPFIKNTPTEIKLKAPAHAAGLIDVVVTTAGGPSATVAADHFTYVAPLALTVSNAGTGSGSVTCDGGACAATYPFGAKVTLAATAASGSTFSGWNGAGCSGTGTCVVTFETDTTITATFTANPKPSEPSKPGEPAKPSEPSKPAEPPKCIVPKLAGKTLAQAKTALSKAHCALGKITKPKKAKGALVVKSTSPAAGKVLAANTKVSLKLAPKPKKRRK
jgi:hypothetical protein